MGRRLKHQHRSLETPTGSLALTSFVVKPENMKMRAMRGDENVIETFAGSLILMPTTKKRRMKIQAFFVQNVMKNGAYSISPTLSFHAIVPLNSEVFRLIRQGDLTSLILLFEKGLASLTDCDPDGRSLLSVSS